MNITYVYYTDHNQRSAHNNQIIHTCNALDHAGHTVTVVTSGGLQQYANKHGLAVSFEIYKMYPTGLHPLASQILYYLGALRVAYSSDILFTRDISFLKLLKLIPESLTPPIIFEAHKCYSVVDDMDRTEEQWRLKRADGIITISDGIRSDIEALNITVDAVVRDAANTEYVPATTRQELRTKLNIDQDTIVFIYAGSLNPDKYDLRGIIKAFQSLESRDAVRLYILGGTPSNINQLKQYTSSVGIEDTVQFIGHVPQKLVFQYLTAADIGIVAQQPTDVRASKYTSPLKLFEYLVCGLGVIATNVSSIREVADDEPRILTYDPDGHKDLITTLKTVTDEYTSLQSDKRSTQYSYQYRAEQLLSVLNKYN